MRAKKKKLEQEGLKQRELLLRKCCTNAAIFEKELVRWREGADIELVSVESS